MKQCNLPHFGGSRLMIDGAALPFEENIAFTREAVDFCKSFGVPVEAELGAILGKEDDHVSEADCKTEPEKVQRFVEETGCDMLAVSIGNVHGLEDIPRIDIPLLQRIASVCPVPWLSTAALVLMKRFYVALLIIKWQRLILRVICAKPLLLQSEKPG